MKYSRVNTSWATSSASSGRPIIRPIVAMTLLRYVRTMRLKAGASPYCARCRSFWSYPHGITSAIGRGDGWPQSHLSHIWVRLPCFCALSNDHASLKGARHPVPGERHLLACERIAAHCAWLWFHISNGAVCGRWDVVRQKKRPFRQNLDRGRAESDKLGPHRIVCRLAGARSAGEGTGNG